MNDIADDSTPSTPTPDEEALQKPDVEPADVMNPVRSALRAGFKGIASAAGTYGGNAMKEYGVDRVADVASRSESLGKAAAKQFKKMAGQ